MNNAKPNSGDTVHHGPHPGVHPIFNAFQELKEPLSSMQGLLLLISYLPKSDEMQQYTRLLEECAGQMEIAMNKMARFMKSFSTVRTEGKLDAAELIGTVLDSFSERIAEHHIHVHTQIEQNQAWIGDHHSVSEILRQLISNSINFRDRDKSSRKVDLRARVTPHFVRLEVFDNGKGIAAQHQPRVFEPFFKASEQSKGLGIGLFLVKEMVRSLGGSLDFESEENAGTTFVVTLPNRLYQ